MTEKLQQTIKEEIGKLPKITQDAISAVEWTAIAEQIGKKYSLDESQINDFQVQVLLILTGLRDAALFSEYLEKDVRTTKEVSAQIADESLEQIFNPIVNAADEHIKSDIMNRKTDAIRNINFILSGGSYAAYIENIDANTNNKGQDGKLIGSSDILQVKSKLIN